jgi:hypothetical protein
VQKQQLHSSTASRAGSSAAMKVLIFYSCAQTRRRERGLNVKGLGLCIKFCSQHHAHQIDGSHLHCVAAMALDAHEDRAT